MTMTSSEPRAECAATSTSPECPPNPRRLPNPEPLFVSTALLEQARQMCKLRLAKDPDNRSALASLAQIYRKEGNLGEASALYKRLSELNPVDREANYLHAILTGMEAPPPRLRPAPFVVLKDFLPREFHQTLLPFVLSIQEKLIPAMVGIGIGEYNPNVRESLDLPGKWEVKKRFRDCVSEMIPKVAPRLNVLKFEIGELEVKVRAYLDGHFFRVHMDCPPDDPIAARRKVSYVYFFHKMPRAYTGGDLLLFDSDIDTYRYTTSSFTRIVPEDNSIVFFPSAYWHSVVPISCPSKEFVDSRFVINGHVGRVPKPAEKGAENGAEPRVPVAACTPEAPASNSPVAVPS